MRAIERVVYYMGAKPSGRYYFVFEFQLEFWHYRGICTVGWGDSMPKAERKRIRCEVASSPFSSSPSSLEGAQAG